ncbi:MAG: aspartate aminotransferase family protein [Firmicutes bacterium]|nr:aspartate aminotransferase family protein [Bacillota bacterium]
MSNADLQKNIMNTYGRFPLTLVKGEGLYAYDDQGRKFVDFGSGISVNNLGHCHPAVVSAIQKQAETLCHCSNLYWSEPQLVVAEYLTKYSGLDRVFFCNSGAEANEGAIKLARKYFYDKGQSDKFEIITMKKSFHGRTLATLTATGQDKVKTGFWPLPDGFVYADFNNAESIKEAYGPHTCAVMMEPVQGEGGIYPMDEAFIEEVAAFCKEKGLLLIFDEIQCGMGRTGSMFCYEQYGIKPDIVTCAKALGGGLPFGAFVASEEVAASFGPGTHGSTFGANPVAAAASAAVFKTMEEDNVLDNVKKISAYLVAKLEELKEEYPSLITDVRGKGLLIGMEVTCTAAPIVNACIEKGLILLNAGPDVVRFLPPLNITEKDVDFVIETLKNVLKEW